MKRYARITLLLMILMILACDEGGTSNAFKSSLRFSLFDLSQIQLTGNNAIIWGSVSTGAFALDPTNFMYLRLGVEGGFPPYTWELLGNDGNELFSISEEVVKSVPSWLSLSEANADAATISGFVTETIGAQPINKQYAMLMKASDSDGASIEYKVTVHVSDNPASAILLPPADYEESVSPDTDES